MALQKPILTFELGLTAGFRDALSSVAWTDITPYVLSWGTSRGREPRKPPSHFEPGVANLLLNNRDRRFDPTNTASPYSPNLKPARVRLRIRARWPLNLLTPNQASIETDTTGWNGLTNCAVARSTAFAAHGGASLALTAVAAGSMVASTTPLIPVYEGFDYTFLAGAKAGAGSMDSSVGVWWYDSAGVFISGSASAVVAASTAGFHLMFHTATAPAGAAFAVELVAMTAAAPGSVGYIDMMSVAPGTYTAWTPGGVVEDVFTGYVKRWPPQWTASSTSTVAITAVDALGAPLNLAQIAGSFYETVVRHDRPKVWLRMAESSGTVATDATMHRLDGQYQGSPALGQPGLVSSEANDKATRFVTGSRLSLPYKNLIVAYPFSFECWFVCGSVSGQKVFLAAYDGPAGANRQYLQFYIGTDIDSGKIVALVANPYPTGTQIVSTINVDDGAAHHLAIVCASSTDFKMYIDGADRTSVFAANAHAFPTDLVTGYAIGNTPAVAFGDFRFGNGADDILAEPAIYDTALSTTRISKHYAAGIGYSGAPFVGQSGAHIVRLLEEADWPGDHDADTGESYVQTLTTAGSLVANLQKVEASEQGALFVDESGIVIFQGRHALLSAPYNVSQVTLGQGVLDQPYEAPVLWGNDDAELYNRASGSRAGGPTYTVTDDDSVDDYGERPLPNVGDLWNTTDGEVVDLLTYRVQKYSEPASSVRQVRLHPAAVPSLWPYVLGLGLRSRVTIKVAPPGGGPVFSQESHIERISHEVDDKGDWWTTWDVSAADSTPYMVLDSATLGVLDAENRLAL